MLGRRAWISDAVFPVTPPSSATHIKQDDYWPPIILMVIADRDTNGDGFIDDGDAQAAYFVSLDGRELM